MPIGKNNTVRQRSRHSYSPLGFAFGMRAWVGWASCAGMNSWMRKLWLLKGEGYDVMPMNKRKPGGGIDDACHTRAPGALQMALWQVHAATGEVIRVLLPIGVYGYLK